MTEKKVTGYLIDNTNRWLLWGTDIDNVKKINLHTAIQKPCLFIKVHDDIYVNVKDLIWPTKSNPNTDIKLKYGYEEMYINDAIIAGVLFIDEWKAKEYVDTQMSMQKSLGGTHRHCKRKPKKSTKRSRIVKHSTRTMSARKYKNRK